MSFKTISEVLEYFNAECKNYRPKVYMSVSHHVDSIRLDINKEKNHGILITKSTYSPYFSSSPISQTTVYSNDICHTLFVALQLAKEHNYKIVN